MYTYYYINISSNDSATGKIIPIRLKSSLTLLYLFHFVIMTSQASSIYINQCEILKRVYDRKLSCLHFNAVLSLSSLMKSEIKLHYEKNTKFTLISLSKINQNKQHIKLRKWIYFVTPYLLLTKFNVCSYSDYLCLRYYYTCTLEKYVPTFDLTVNYGVYC